MQKAQLSSAQRGHSLVAGAVGHLLFFTGWLLLGFVVLGGGIALLLGGTATTANGLFGNVPQFNEIISLSADFVGVVIIIVALLALVLIALGALASGLILKRGKVRKPWLVTFQALGIVALADVPLSIGYVSLAAALSDSAASGIFLVEPVLRFVGTIVIGALVWWLMAWLRRGSASTFAGVTATASATALPDPQN